MLRGASRQEPEAEPPTWWESGFRDGNWKAATRALSLLPKRDRPPAHALLLECARGESELTGGVAPDGEAAPAHFPFSGAWGSDALTSRKPQALRWADWLLRAAPGPAGGGQLDGALRAVLDQLADPESRGPSCHGTEEAWWAALASGVDDLLSLPPAERERVFETLAQSPDSGWAVQHDRVLPETFEGRLVLTRRNYEIRQPVTIPAEAELWIERGAELRLSSRELPLDPRYPGTVAISFIRCEGTIRTFGDSEEPVRMILKKVPEDHPDRVNAIRFVDSFEALASIEVQYMDDASTCAGIYSNTTLWLVGCSFDGRKSKRQHVGVECGGPNPPTAFYFESCSFEELAIGLQHNRSSALSVHNSFVRNEMGISVGGMNDLLFLSHDDFLGNEFDVHDGNQYGGRIRMRDCNLTGKVQLRQDQGKEYDLSGNWWKRGRKRQIVDFDEDGAFRAILGATLAKRNESAGVR